MDVMGFFEMPVVSAALLLALALVVSSVARVLVGRLVGGTKAAEALSHAEQSTGERPGTLRGHLGTLAFLVVFLLFVPGIFAVLGVDMVGVPILGMLGSVWNYLPNLVGAAVIMAIGLIVARLVRQLLVPFLEHIGVNRLQERMGVRVDERARLSVALATVAYVLVIVPTAVAALQVLGIRAISEPAVDMLDEILLFLPALVGGLLVGGIGLLVARAAGRVVERLVASTGIDARMAEMADGRMGALRASRAVAGLVQMVIAVLFLVEAFEIVRLDMLADMGEGLIAYLPTALVAVGIVIAAVVASRAVGKLLESSDMAGFVLPARVGIGVVATFMALSQLGVAPAIVNTTFAAIVIAAAVAAAIAFGIGGRSLAARLLRRWSGEADRGERADLDRETADPKMPEAA